MNELAVRRGPPEVAANPLADAMGRCVVPAAARVRVPMIRIRDGRQADALVHELRKCVEKSRRTGGEYTVFLGNGAGTPQFGISIHL